MGIYTKNGDKGRTSLLDQVSVSKTDDRIELLGNIDELNSQIGLAKTLANPDLREQLSHIQRTLMRIMSGIASPRSAAYAFDEKETAQLEAWIDSMENSFPRLKDFVLYGGCEESARLDLARAVTRRAERRFYSVAQKYGADAKALQYMNRLSDYFYMAARFTDYKAEQLRNS